MEEEIKPLPSLVLEEIFRSLIPADLLNVRLVCWEWNMLASKTYQRRGVELHLHQAQAEGDQMATGVELLQQTHCTLPKPRNIRFGQELFQRLDVVAQFQTTFGQFLSLVSDEIESITVETDALCQWTYDAECYSDLVEFPKLKELRMSGDHNRSTIEGNFFLSFCEHMLRSSPALRVLDIQDHDTSEASDTGFGDIWAIIPSGVQELKILTNGIIRRSQIESFGALNLPRLSGLIMVLYNCSEISGTDVSNIFNHSKNETLTRLGLVIAGENCTEVLMAKRLLHSIARNMEPLSLEFPEFPNLTNLALACYCNKSVTIAKSGRTFNELFPNVSSLSLHFLEGFHEIFQTLFPPRSTASQVTSYVSRSPLDDSDFLHLVRCFVSLKEIHLLVKNESDLSKLPLILEWCSSLHDLSLEFHSDYDGLGVDIDSILTGIPVDILDNIRQAEDWAAVELAHVKSNPGLADLNQLKTLSIRNLGVSARESNNITDFTACFGIECLLQNNSLQKLSTDAFKMSVEWIEYLQLVAENVGTNICVY